MIILGIDPGLATTGYGVIKVNPKKKYLTSNTSFENGFELLIDYRCLVTDKALEEPKRLNSLYKDTQALLKLFKPDVITIERLFFFKNAKTIISVGQARGVVILAASQFSIPVLEYAPLQVKSVLTGYGRSKKKEVEKKVKEILNTPILKIKKEKKSKDGHHIDDAVDALAVAICHTFKMREKLIKIKK